MNAALLSKILGEDRRWNGACTVIMNANAGVFALGVDSIVGGGAKSYAPRIISGRVSADYVCFLKDHNALLVVQHLKVKQTSGEEAVKQSLIVADIDHVAGVEFPDTSALGAMGLTAPPKSSSGSHPGFQWRTPAAG